MQGKNLEAVYDRYARIYDLIFGAALQSGREREPRLLDLYPGAKLLDVGVGTGLSIPGGNGLVEITGVDLSQGMLDQAARRMEKRGMRNVRLLRMDATQMDFPDHAFDRVLAAYFISTVPDPVRVVREMKRVCRPGGYLVFLNHFQSEGPIIGRLEKLISPLCYRIGFRTDLNLRELLETCGLEVETLEKIDALGVWKAVRCVNPKP
jgi:phosphatidylethanolamine/phosphatidyl-N-methylethanolamine N-methyltransferase